MATLQTELDLALRRSRTEDELVAALRSAAEETERLTNLAEDLLVLARADGGRLPIRRESIDVGELLHDATTASLPRATAQGITLATRAPDGTIAALDPARIRQVVANLVDNALSHTPRGGHVDVTLSQEPSAVVIAVADTGDGFPPAFLPHAFEPFSRAEAARSRTDGGTGLGLAIVQAIAEAHGGSATAANRPEGGAAVMVRLPA